MNTLCDRERVYLDYRDKVRRYISGKVRNIHDIEDLTSDVFVKVYEKPPFRRGYIRLPEIP